MDRNEAVQKLATAGRLSIAHAEDLYDSFFEKPVVPQCVADWYEEHKNGYDYELWDYFTCWDDQEDDDFKDWIREDKNQPILTLVSMHQFGYEVEKETRYTVEVKGINGSKKWLVFGELTECWWFSVKEKTSYVVLEHTRKELEEADFGWVFDCPGVEVKEVE
ncbi:DUF1642 domain-containing protein [Streptococcus salivarius]